MAIKQQQQALLDSDSDRTEDADLKALLREWDRLCKPILDLSKVKPNRPESLQNLERALDRLPEEALFGRAYQELKVKTKALIDAERRRRHNEFGRHEVQFIESIKRRDISIRELDQAWRVGRCEIEVQRDQSKARALYNREVLIPWNPVVRKDDLESLYDKAESKLQKASLNNEAMIEVWWRAYSDLACSLRRKDQSGPVRVPLLDLYRETRVALIRHELRTGRADRKPKYAEFPKWAFLYNFDRYLGLGSRVEKDQRIAVETGSQRDQSAKRGIVLNGLDPHDEYKVFCYAVSLS